MDIKKYSKNSVASSNYDIIINKLFVRRQDTAVLYIYTSQ